MNDYETGKKQIRCCIDCSKELDGLRRMLYGLRTRIEELEKEKEDE